MTYSHSDSRNIFMAIIGVNMNRRMRTAAECTEHEEKN